MHFINGNWGVEAELFFARLATSTGTVLPGIILQVPHARSGSRAEFQRWQQRKRRGRLCRPRNAGSREIRGWILIGGALSQMPE